MDLVYRGMQTLPVASRWHCSTQFNSTQSDEYLVSQVFTGKVKVAQSCPTLWDPIDYIYSQWNSPGQNTGVGSHSLLQRIFPTQGLNPSIPHCGRILYQLSYQGSPRILEWVAYPFSNESS